MNRYLVSQKTEIIPIKNSSPTIVEGEYSLTENVFDPSKSSPPNNFLEKLQLRISIYNSNNDNN
jgi:hypothetical protein